ncbi:Nuclear cap-binding protein subunit 1 [Sorochytrium milnesiophthora]
MSGNEDARLPQRPGRRSGRPEMSRPQSERTRIKKVLTVLGTNAADVAQEIEATANDVVHVHGGDATLVPSLLADCAAEFAHKPHIIAALLACVASRNMELAEETATAMGKRLQDAVTACQWSATRTMLRTLSLLSQSVFYDMASLQAILGVFVDALQQNEASGFTDNIVSVLAAVLPFAGPILAAKDGGALANILSAVRQYVEERTSSKQRLSVLSLVQPLNPESAPFVQEDYLLVVLKQLDALQAADWRGNFLNDFVKGFSKTEAEVSPFTVAAPNLPAPSPGQSAPWITFRIFDDNLEAIVGLKQAFKPHVPKSYDAERLVLTELVTDVLHVIHVNHKEGTPFLLELRSMFTPGVWAVEGENEDGGPQFNFEQTLIELLFAQLLRLPTSHYKPIFLHNVIMDLCKLHPSRVGPAFGKAVQVCFDRLNYTDAECAIRLVGLFGHHLSNYDFKWSWSNWAYILDEDPVSKKVFFVRESMAKLVRLAYFDRIVETIPDEFKPSVFPSTAPRMAFTYAEPSEGVSEQMVSFGHNIASSIRGKDTWESVWAVCKETSHNMDMDIDRLRDIAIQTLLSCGSKTFSHTVNVMERYLQIFTTLADTPENRVHLIAIVYHFWKFNIQFFLVILEKLIIFKVVEGGDVLRWLFDREDVVRIADQLYVFEILKVVTKTAVFRVSHLRSRMHVAGAMEVDTPATTEAQVLQSSLEAAESDLKQMYLTLFEKLVKTIGTFQGRYDDMWTNWLTGYLASILRTDAANFGPFMATLANSVFVTGAPQVTLQLFESTQQMLD